MVAVFIFAIGSGLSLYEGYEHLRHPEPLGDPTWNYAVLAIAFAFDGASFLVARRTFNAQRGQQPFWEAFRNSKDPSVFVVLFEDASDLLGLIIAFLGVFLSDYLNMPALDGVASLLIGLLLLVVAGLLLRETKSLLLGEPAEATLLTKITAMVEAEKAIVRASPPLSSYLSPHEILVVVPVEFAPDLPASQVTQVISQLCAKIKAAYPDVQHIFMQPAELPSVSTPPE